MPSQPGAQQCYHPVKGPHSSRASPCSQPELTTPVEVLENCSFNRNQPSEQDLERSTVPQAVCRLQMKEGKVLWSFGEMWLSLPTCAVLDLQHLQQLQERFPATSCPAHMQRAHPHHSTYGRTAPASALSCSVQAAAAISHLGGVVLRYPGSLPEMKTNLLRLSTGGSPARALLEGNLCRSTRGLTGSRCDGSCPFPSVRGPNET